MMLVNSNVHIYGDDLDDDGGDGDGDAVQCRCRCGGSCS